MARRAGLHGATQQPGQGSGHFELARAVCLRSSIQEGIAQFVTVNLPFFIDRGARHAILVYSSGLGQELAARLYLRPVNSKETAVAMIPTRCSSCGFQGRVPQAFVGKKVKCRQCGKDFTIAVPDATAGVREDVPETAQVNDQPGRKSKKRLPSVVAGLFVVAALTAGGIGLWSLNGGSAAKSESMSPLAEGGPLAARKPTERDEASRPSR